MMEETTESLCMRLCAAPDASDKGELAEAIVRGLKREGLIPIDWCVVAVKKHRQYLGIIVLDDGREDRYFLKWERAQ